MTATPKLFLSSDIKYGFNTKPTRDQLVESFRRGTHIPVIITDNQVAVSVHIEVTSLSRGEDLNRLHFKARLLLPANVTAQGGNRYLSSTLSPGQPMTFFLSSTG